MDLPRTRALEELVLQSEKYNTSFKESFLKPTRNFFENQVSLVL